ncbi:hypothetical protein [Vulcanisaeta sp. JCM 14467]|uniref:hypothetical protein n=1 Tax=Vulcanisaeta sp. JCM 14467 TaxID=1295370 RepID=UPI0006D03890|nr:hypothetical protein [Vulcanisaeta sp. JCM 14467]
MIKLILGRLDYQGIERGVTFRLSGNAKPLDGVPNAGLTPLGRALINRVFHELGINCDATHVTRLSDVLENCGFALPASVELTNNYDVGELRTSLYSAPIPTIEPLSTIIGLALASALRVNTEFYSDLWPRLTDALAQLKALGVDVAIHSSVFDPNRFYIFDEIVRRLIRVPRTDELRETTDFNSKVEVIGVSRRFIEYPARPFNLAEPREPKIDDDVVNAVEVLVRDLGGVATLKSLTDMLRSQDAVLKAITIGYMTYNPGDLTVRITTKALSLLKSLSHSGDVLEEGKPASGGSGESGWSSGGSG